MLYRQRPTHLGCAMYCSPGFSSTEYNCPLPTSASSPRPVTSELPQWAIVCATKLVHAREIAAWVEQTRLVSIVGRIDIE